MPKEGTTTLVLVAAEDRLVGNPISEPISNVMTSLVETLISVGDTIWWHLCLVESLGAFVMLLHWDEI